MIPEEFEQNCFLFIQNKFLKDREKVALNTVLSQAISAIWYFECLLRGASSYWLKLYKVASFWPIDFMFLATNCDWSGTCGLWAWDCLRNCRKKHKKKCCEQVHGVPNVWLLSFLPVCLSTVKNFSPSSTLYTTLALLPYVGSSASDAVTFMTEVPVEKRQLNVKKENKNFWASRPLGKL